MIKLKSCLIPIIQQSLTHYRFCYYVSISYFALHFSKIATSGTAELDEDLILDTEAPTAMDTDWTNIDKTGKVFVYSYKYLVTNYKTDFTFINWGSLEIYDSNILQV